MQHLVQLVLFIVQVNNLIQLITVSGNFNVGEKLISSSQTTSNNANQFIKIQVVMNLQLQLLHQETLMM